MSISHCARTLYPCVRAAGGRGTVLLLLLYLASPATAVSPVQLPDAVEHQDKPAIRALLQQRVDVNAPQADGMTALHWAAHHDDLDTAQLLLRAGADVNRVTDSGITPLWLASHNRSARIAAVLVAAGANPNAALPTGETVLMRAAWTGSAEIVTLLLVHRADFNAKENELGQTALMWAISQGHPDVARILVEKGANIHARSTTGSTPLLFAARVGDLESARLLVAAGASVNDAVKSAERPSPRAALARGINAILLGDKKSTFLGGKSKCIGYFPICNPSAGSGGSALLIATVRGHTEFAKFLLDRGADPNADGGAGYTALHWAAGAWGTERHGKDGIARGAVAEWDATAGLQGEAKLGLIKALLAHGADPNARLQRMPPRTGRTKESHWGIHMAGATPLLLAAQAGNASAMRLLVASGADPRLGTNENTSVVMAAASMGRLEDERPVPETDVVDAVKLALDLGNDINAVNEMGDTALHAAAANRLNTVIQFLVDQGARANVKNSWGQTPLSMAELVRTFAGAENVFEHTSAGDLLRKLGGTK